MFHNKMEQDDVYLNKYFVGEPYSDYLFKVDYTVIFTNEKKNINKRIVDQAGNILHFPGVDYTDGMKAELGKWSIEPVVKYEAIFEKVNDNKFIMVWTVRPDGRYWMDSWGFGAEDYESLSLYTYIDLDGNFMAPFKLYSIGYECFGDYRVKRA